MHSVIFISHNYRIWCIMATLKSGYICQVQLKIPQPCGNIHRKCSCLYRLYEYEVFFIHGNALSIGYIITIEPNFNNTMTIWKNS